MDIRRRKRKLPDGSVVEDRKNTYAFRDHRGKKRSIALFEGKRPSEAFARRILRLVEARQGGEPLDRESMEWIGRIPPRIRNYLIKIGVVDSRRIASTVPLESHLDDWSRSLKQAKRSHAHRSQTQSRVRRTFSTCAFHTWSDINKQDVADYLEEQTGPDGWGASTFNAYVQSVKQFTKWMLVEERAVIDPLVALKKATKGDPRLERAALTHEQCRALVRAAETSTVVVDGVEPQVRALAIRLALQTGLRLREVAQMKVKWIRWASETQPLTVLYPQRTETKAGKKSGRRDTIVVPTELERHLKEAIRGRHASAYVCPGIWKPNADAGEGAPKNGRQMMRLDLAAAGIPLVTEEGLRVDFHALRHTFVTQAIASGMSQEKVQFAARHTDPRVTAGYAHARELEVRDGLDRVPGLDGPPDSGPESHEVRMAAGAELMAGPHAGNLCESDGVGHDERGRSNPQMGGSYVFGQDLESSFRPLRVLF